MNRVIQSFQHNKIWLRLVSAMLLIPPVWWICIIGGQVFIIAALVLSVLMAFEWQSVTGSLRVKNPKVWKALGVLYITSFIASLLYIRSHEYGLWWLVYLLVVIWSTDTGAYICGITFGGAKIAPKISPSKSWTGFIGGVIASALAVQLLIYLTDLNLLNQAGDIWVTIFISIVGQIGDLAESYWKRRFKVKDSGDIIPGHGGVLDRMDSLVFASVALVLIMITMS